MRTLVQSAPININNRLPTTSLPRRLLTYLDTMAILIWLNTHPPPISPSTKPTECPTGFRPTLHDSPLSPHTSPLVAHLALPSIPARSKSLIPMVRRTRCPHALCHRALIHDRLIFRPNRRLPQFSRIYPASDLRYPLHLPLSEYHPTHPLIDANPSRHQIPLELSSKTLAARCKHQIPISLCCGSTISRCTGLSRRLVPSYKVC